MSNQILAEPGESIPLALTLEDGAVGLFPQARVIDEAGTVVATVDLVHVVQGTYQAPYTVPGTAQQLIVNYTVYVDAAHLTPDPSRGRGQDVIVVAAIATLPTAIWNQAETTAFDSNSMGNILKLLKGSMAKANMRIDKLVHDPSLPFTLSGKMRIFPTSALAAASSSRASGDTSLEGAIFEIDVSGVADGTHQTLPSTMLGVVTTEP